VALAILGIIILLAASNRSVARRTLSVFPSCQVPLELRLKSTEQRLAVETIGKAPRAQTRKTTNEHGGTIGLTAVTSTV
jgi:hypothetical protein